LIPLSDIRVHILNLFIYFQDETEEVDIIRKSKDILTKLESRFARIAKEIIRHFSKEFADSSLKSLIECAICKEILIGVNIF